MSDRTYTQGSLAFERDVTAEERERFDNIMAEYHADTSGDPDDPKELAFTIDELTLGSGREVAEALHKEFPEATHVLVWEDPKYEYLGMLYEWTAERGDWFEHECDANGNVTLTAPEIEKIINEAGDDRDELVAGLLAALGEAPPSNLCTGEADCSCLAHATERDAAKPTVYVSVSGGIAEAITTGNVDVLLVDWDNYREGGLLDYEVADLEATRENLDALPQAGEMGKWRTAALASIDEVIAERKGEDA